MLTNCCWDSQASLNFGFDKSSTEPCGKVENFNPTDDGESSEKSHCASNKTQLALKLDLLVPHNFVVGGRVKEYVDKLER